MGPNDVGDAGDVAPKAWLGMQVKAGTQDQILESARKHFCEPNQQPLLVAAGTAEQVGYVLRIFCMWATE